MQRAVRHRPQAPAERGVDLLHDGLLKDQAVPDPQELPELVVAAVVLDVVVADHHRQGRVGAVGIVDPLVQPRVSGGVVLVAGDQQLPADALVIGGVRLDALGEEHVRQFRGPRLQVEVASLELHRA